MVEENKKVWLECLILEVSEQQGEGFLSLFGCWKTAKISGKKDSYLSDLFDLGASFANQWATLAPWENQTKCHRWLACHIAVCHCCSNILRERFKNMLFFFSANCKNVSFIWQVFFFFFARLTKMYIQCPSDFSQNLSLHIYAKQQDFIQDMLKEIILFFCTSSNFCAIMEKALKMPSVGPVMVTILSGDDPSDMLIRAPL